MLLKTFDFGWESNNGDLPIPVWNSENLRSIASGYDISEPAILVNSTWYTDEVHAKVVSYIKENKVRNVIIASLCDAHIARREMYDELDVNVFEIGYFRGKGFYDFFALAFHKLHRPLPDQQLLDYQLIHKPFMCLNRKHHEHRVRIVNELRSADLTSKGIVTLSGTDLCLDEDFSGHVPVAPESGAEIPNDIVTLGRTDVWCSHFLNVVTESWWDINQAYLAADKYFKPLVGLRPFLIWCEDMGVEWLTDRKFELYHYDFGDITDLDLTNHENMIPFLKTLSEQPTGYLHQKYVALREKLLYNRNRFNEYVDEQDLDKVIGEMNATLGTNSSREDSSGRA